MNLNNKNSILIDLDNTIAISDFEKEYSQLKPDQDILDSIKIVRDQGYKVKIHTSRNMRTFNGDIEKIKNFTLPKIEHWLNDNNIFYDEIIVGKAWGGSKGIYVDDKSLTPFEFKLRTFSSTIFKSISVVASFYNENQNIKRFWNQLIELDKYLNVNQFIFVDNGSNDNTFELLNSLRTNDKRVIILQNKYPSSYSKGISTGLKKVKSEYTLFLHSDCQINSDIIIKSWLEEMFIIRKDNKELFIKNKKVLTTYRLNRGFKENLFSTTNNLLAYLFLRWPLFIDFNSMPKIINTSIIKETYLKKGFLFDLIIVDNIVKKSRSDKNIYFLKPYPVIVKKRLKGKSSWDGNFLKTLSIIKSYLGYIFK